jgi:phosphoglycolate phosphatase-like HAD superfamily hydrolase
MIITEYKKFRGVVSFDFDGVLHTSMIPGTLHPINFRLSKTWKPNLKLHDILRNEQKTHKVIIVTARDTWNKPQIKEFLDMWNLHVDDIVTTDNRPKLDYLINNNVIRHYDDNPKMITELKDSGIEFILVDGEKLKKID